jgi:hypothetical protein
VSLFRSLEGAPERKSFLIKIPSEDCCGGGGGGEAAVQSIINIPLGIQP